MFKSVNLWRFWTFRSGLTNNLTETQNPQDE